MRKRRRPRRHDRLQTIWGVVRWLREADGRRPAHLRGVRQVEDWALGRDHTYGGRRPCRTVCVGSGWTFTRTRVSWRSSTMSPARWLRAALLADRSKCSTCCASCRDRCGRCMRRARPAMAWCGGRGRRGSRWRSARRATSSVGRVIGPRTDKRDAIRLARLFAAGDLRLVWVPSEEHEQLRDLVRCPGGSARGPDARPAPASDVPVAPRALLARAGRAVDAQAPALALPAAVRRRGASTRARRV